jgi:sugar lactone lactonase YvrE
MNKYLLTGLLLMGISFSQAQTITTVAGGNGTGADSIQLNYPYGIWLDRNGNVYVSDQTNNTNQYSVNSRIQMFPTGSTSATGGITVAGGNGPGFGANQLYNPAGICMDSSGNLYIADFGNDRIQEFPAGSTSLSSGLTVAGGNLQGNLPFQLSDPEDVFVDGSGNIYVADADNDRIQMFPAGSTSASNGITVAGGRGLGAEAYQLSYPDAVFVDVSGNLYVADYLNNRIQKFPPGSDSTTNGVTVAGGNGLGSNANQLNSPTGIFVDRNGNLYVADFYNNRVQMFPAGSDSATNGITVAGGNGQGDAPEQLSNPTSIYVDTSGSIYIVDQLNNRVQKWSPTPAGISTIPTAETISLYPNPNNGSFLLQSSGDIGKEYIICDMIGRVVGQGVIASEEQTIAIKDLSTGAYSLEIKGSGAIRFVVEN